jgi:hypothetical protein
VDGTVYAFDRFVVGASGCDVRYDDKFVRSVSSDAFFELLVFHDRVFLRFRWDSYSRFARSKGRAECGGR